MRLSSKNRPMEGRLAYSCDEAGAVIGVSHLAIRSAVKNGQLRARKLGKRTLIMRDELVRFLNSLPAGISQEPKGLQNARKLQETTQ